MTKAEMKTKFATLYSIMANSKKVNNMKLFGAIMSEAMMGIIEEHPEVAEKYINTLCAVKWNNYLTKDEAEEICKKMQPTAHWTMEEVEDAVERLGGEVEKKPCYNKYALWVVMNMVYSDSVSTITSIIGTNNQEHIANAVYLLATDKLCDEDEVFNVRTYFGID